MNEMLNEIKQSVGKRLRQWSKREMTFSLHLEIQCAPAELFKFLENPENWKLFSFHGISTVEYYHGNWKINSAYGPGMLHIHKSREFGVLDHRLVMFFEDEWKIYLRITPYVTGSQLMISLTKPRSMPGLYFESRTVEVTSQLNHLKSLVE
jgi:hypothetical protein